MPTPSETTAHIDDLAAFITASPSSFHAAAESARRLTEAGFTELNEVDEWPAEPGSFFVVRDGAIVAWIVPEGAAPHIPFRIVGAHTDSPGFKLKPKPTTSAYGWLQAGVEVYGGPLVNSWLDRELEFAGRVAFTDGTTALVRTGAFLRFPQLAVHLDRAVNSEGLKLDPQRHMNPIFGVGDLSQADLVDHLASLAGRGGADVAGYDIVVADTQPPRTFGLNNSLFAAPRLDNLVSVHAGLTALIGLPVPEPVEGRRPVPEPVEGPTALTSIPVFAAFDHEEVGSASRSGAAGSFLEDTLARIHHNLSATPSDRARSFAASLHLSADAGHAIHPNYPDRHDPANRPIVNAGPLLKLNANQRYATDALGAAAWARACADVGVEYQKFVSNNAVPCGSTIGPITATRLGIRTIDVGVPLLSMHSAREMCGVSDPRSLTSSVAEIFMRGAV